MAGGQAFGVAYLLDGATHNNPYDNLNLPLPFPDALQEFRLETSSTTANDGMHSGASVNAVTKSGTNLLPRRPVRVRPQPPLQRHQPVQRARPGDRRAPGRRPEPQPVRRHVRRSARDRPLFFFGAYQGTRVRETPADLFAFVPTAAMLAGDFTQYASAACNSGTARNLRAPFVGNRIDPARMSPAAVNIARRLPATTDPCGRVTYSRSRPQDEHAVHRQGGRAAEPEPFDVRPLHLDAPTS